MADVTTGGYSFRKGKKSSKKELEHLRIHPSENGGHIVQHHFSSAERFHEPEHHVFAKGEGGKMLAHVGKMLGIPHSEEEIGEPEHDEE